jgi:hypothetical protein
MAFLKNKPKYHGIIFFYEHMTSFKALFFDIILWLLERNLIFQLHMYAYLLVKKPTERQRNQRSNISYDESIDASNNDLSTDYESVDSKDTFVRLYETYREVLIQHGVKEKDQQLILKSFHNKTEHDAKMFLR